MNIIDLGTSRYGDERKLHEIEENVWSTEGFKKVTYIRVQPTETEYEYEFVDFDGGPFLTKGGRFADRIIEKIVFNNGRYLIHTKIIEDDKSENNEQQ